MRLFRTIWKWLVPGWLQQGDGELVMHSLGLVNDAFAERCRQTAQLMLPSRAPSDALELIGADRGLVRGLFEPEASFRARLRAWRYPRGHRVRGSALALLEQVRCALRGTEWTTIDARGTQYDASTGTVTRGVTWDWDSSTLLPNWGRYWVIVKSSGTPWPSFDDGAWGDNFMPGDDVSLAGDSIHPGEVAAVRALTRVNARSWTPSGRRPIYLVIYFDGDSFPTPDGDWDEWVGRPRETYAFEPLHDDIT